MCGSRLQRAVQMARCSPKRLNSGSGDSPGGPLSLIPAFNSVIVASRFVLDQLKVVVGMHRSDPCWMSSSKGTNRASAPAQDKPSKSFGRTIAGTHGPSASCAFTWSLKSAHFPDHVEHGLDSPHSRPGLRVWRRPLTPQPNAPLPARLVATPRRIARRPQRTVPSPRLPGWRRWPNAQKRRSTVDRVEASAIHR